MDWQILDSKLDEMESIMPDAPSVFGIGTLRHDWRPVWNLAKEIQLGFNSGVRYPSKEFRQAAWERFNRLRGEASRRGDSEREHFRSTSEAHKSRIFGDCRGIGYSELMDNVFVFDKATVEDMKARGGYLTQVMRYFSEHKGEMLAEHKKECFDRIQEIKEQHDAFWSRYRESRESRRAS